MKKTTEKQKRIIIFSIIIILMSVLLYTVINLVLKINNKDIIQTANIKENAKMNITKEQDNIENDVGSEMDIALLDESTDEKATQKKEKSNEKKENNNEVSDKNYYIRVNYGANVVTVYKKDEEGNYTIPVKAMVCSTGRATPRSGTYGIKGRWEWLKMLGGVYSHYATQITGNILFHSVPYLRNGDHSSLEYWEYDKLRNSMLCGMC